MAADYKGEMMSSSFSQTCRLLSQYLKEKKTTLGNLNIDLPSINCSESLAPKTMSLLPGMEERIHDSKAMMEEEEEEEGKQQLTIFYGGKVLVFDDFPAEKAENLMGMAAKFESIAPARNLRPSSVAAGRATDCPPHSAALPTPAHAEDKVAAAANASDMPMARRNSLHRFLEKRKDRITTEAPYHARGSTVPASIDSTKLESGPSWLNLGNQALALVVGPETNN